MVLYPESVLSRSSLDLQTIEFYKVVLHTVDFLVSNSQGTDRCVRGYRDVRDEHSTLYYKD